jgi:autotransporter-associated beta strand protein
MKATLHNPLLKTLLCAVPLALSATGSAAPITWAAPVTIAGDTDVSTSGTFKFAYNWANSTRTVNGVTFTGTSSTTTVGADLTLTSWGNVNNTAFSSTSAPFTNLSAAYKGMLVGSTFNNSGTGSYGTNTVTLNGLVPGRQYQIQFWVSDPRAIGVFRAETLASTDGNSVSLAFPGGTVAGALGQYSLGSFTADASTQAFTVTTVNGSGSVPQMNAIQLRDLSPPPNIGYWTGTGGATWDPATTANWCLNPANQPLTSGTFAAAMAANSDQAFFDDSYFDNGTPVAVTQNAVTIAAGGVATGAVSFVADVLNYTLGSADDAGLTGGTSLVKGGAGTLTLTGANTHDGGTTLTAGTLNLDHAAALGTGALMIAGGTLGTTATGSILNSGDNSQNWNGNFSFAGGDLNLGAGPVTMNTSPTLNLTAGTLTVGGAIFNTAHNLTKTGSGTMVFGGAVSLNNLDVQNGAVVFDGGSYTATSGNGGWGLWLRSATTSSLTVRNDAAVSVLNGFQIQQGTATIESGSITAVAGGVSEIYLGNSTNPATFNIKGGTVTARVMSFGNGGSAATLNLEGGTLVWNTQPNKSSGSATLNMGGGTLKPGGSFTVPASLPFTLTGTNGPLTIDTQAHTTTLANLLTGAGGVTKDGTGTLVVAATGNDHSGPTTVTTGTLSLTGSLTGGSAVTINGGTCAISPTGAAPASDFIVNDTGTLRFETTGKTLKSLTVASGAALSLIPSATETTMVTGALTLADTPSFTVKPAFTGPPAAGTYVLLTPGSVAGTAGTITTDLGEYGGTRSYHGGTAITGGNLVLTITEGGPAATLVWNNGSATGIWSRESAADKNFSNAGVNDMFYNQDGVTFNGTAPGPVELVGSLAPATLTVDSGTGADYSFAGDGSIDGPVALVKSGGSTLAITTANSFSGGTNLNDGVLAVGHPLALGTTGILRFSGGTLRYEPGNTVDYSARLDAVDQQFKIDTGDQTVTWTSALPTGSGALTKFGEGTLRLTDAPRHGGLTTINGGTLELVGNVVEYQGGPLEINGGSTLRLSGGRYDFNGKTFTFGSAGGGTIYPASADFGGFVQFAAGNTFVTTGGAQNRFDGAGYNLNTHTATFEVAPGTDATSDLRVGLSLTNSGGITKTGLGRLELAGINLYTGDTNINEGDLIVSGSLTAATPITVAGGATLKLAPGGSIHFRPEANNTVRTITGAGAAPFDGTFVIDLSAADPTNGNTWTLVNAAGLTETYGDSFSVPGFTETAANSGVWTMPHANDPAKQWTFTETTGILGIGPASPYQTWAGSYNLTGADALPSADPDGDGIDNGIEFLTGSVPTDPASGNAPTVQRDPGTGNLVVHFFRVDAAEAYAVAVEHGTDLAGWTVIAVPNDGIAGPPVTVVDHDAAPDEITVVIPPGADPRQFARVAITVP